MHKFRIFINCNNRNVLHILENKKNKNTTAHECTQQQQQPRQQQQQQWNVLKNIQFEFQMQFESVLKCNKSIHGAFRSYFKRLQTCKVLYAQLVKLCKRLLQINCEKIFWWIKINCWALRVLKFILTEVWNSYTISFSKIILNLKRDRRR